MKTLIVVILDESGSMGNKKSDVIGGFNEFISEQKKIKNDIARLYLIKFNTIVSVVHTGMPLESVPNLTNETYLPGGMTALYDAIAEGVRMAERDKTTEERVVCLIMTDGEENSSRETTKEQIKDIISGHERAGDWTFIYIGENPERWSKDAGMTSNNYMQYSHDDPHRNYSVASTAMSRLRSSKSRQATNLFDTD